MVVGVKKSSLFFHSLQVSRIAGAHGLARVTGIESSLFAPAFDAVQQQSCREME